MSESIFTAVRAVLALDDTVTGYVTETVDAVERLKIRRQKLAEFDNLPGIVLELQSEDAVSHLSPPATAATARMAVICAAHNSTEAHDLAIAVRDVLDGFRGLAGNDLTLDPVAWESTEHEHIPADDDSDDRDVYIEAPTFEIFYRW